MIALLRKLIVVSALLLPAAALAQPAGGPAAPAAESPAPAAPAAPAPQPAAPPAPQAPAETGAEEPPAGKPGDVTEGHAVVPDEAYAAPEVLTDPEKLPFPARRMRELLIEAARSGDVEKLRPYIGTGDDQTLLSFGGLEEDPISFLKSISGDGEGHEILAILQEVLEAGFVHLEAGTENELYVWPYFHAMQLDKLTPQQRVEMFRLVTYGDYEEMQSFGAYNFYRAGITPEGRWRFFVAGD